MSQRQFSNGRAYAPSDSILRDRDEIELARMGKRQILKRRFGLLSMVGFSCTLMVTWEGVLANLLFGLQNGGPAGLIYSYLIAWAGNLSVFMAMGELSSMFPTAGGQYHWANMLAPSNSRKLISFITGWATVVSWIAGTAADAFICATMVQAAVSFNDPSFPIIGWQGTLLLWAFLLLLVLLTTVFGRMLPALEIVLLLLHIVGFLGTMIPLVYSASTSRTNDGRAREVFGTFFNLGGWSSQTLSFFIGIQGNALAFLGADGAIHMCEEVAGSSLNVARSMILSIIINGVLGLALLIAILFAVDDIEALSNIQGLYPYIQVIADGFKDTGGALAVTGLIIFMTLASSVAFMSSTSRMMWSFARDHGLPGCQWLKKVDRRTSIPVNTVFTTAIAAALLGLINIPSATAFQDIVSIVLEGFYLSYLLVLSLLLYRRVRGDIHEQSRDSMVSSTGSAGQEFVWGPWRIKGVFGLVNNMAAVVYLSFVSFFSFWPESAAVTAKSMNYSVLVLGTVMIGSITWYFLGGRKQFSGPLVEVQVVEESLIHLPKDGS